MSEEETKKPEGPDIDGALKSLLGDLESQAPETAPASTPAPEFTSESTSIPVPESAPASTLAPDVVTPGSENPEPIVAESAVVYGTVPRPHLNPRGAYRSPRRWPWIALMGLCVLGTLLLLSRQHWYPEVQKRYFPKVPPREQAVEMPAALALPAMDEPFLPPGTDTTGQAGHDSAKSPSKVLPEARVIPPQTAVIPEPKPANKPERPVERKGPRAMDSVVIRDIQGVMAGQRVHFHVNIALFSSASGLSAKLPPFEEAIRAVTSNIFYFTSPGKAKIPEIEQQILQKAGFLFPDGKLIRVELQGLELEKVLP